MRSLWTFLFVTLSFAPGVNAQRFITTVAGNGIASFSGDGGPATSASLNFPSGVAVDASGNLFIADLSNQRIRKVDATTGIITTVAGNGTIGFSGDGGPATDASLRFPFGGLAVDSSGNIFIGDRNNNRVRRVDAATGIITTVAGSGPTGFGNGSFSGDGGPATSARLNIAVSVAVDSAGNLFIADQFNNRIRKVDTGGIITTVAGNGFGGFSGDGGPATDASLRFPFGVAVDAAGNLLIADSSNNRVRRVDAATGIITTVAGGGNALGDGGPATSAILQLPLGVAVDASGNLFIADVNHGRIRQVDATTGIITTVAGNGTIGFSGDGGPATDASFHFPWGVAVDSSGTIFIADQRNHRIRGVMRVGELIQQLIADVVALNLERGIASSLDSKLEAVLQALDDVNANNNVAAINALQAFINAVEAQRGIHIPEADADKLIADAQAIIALLAG